MRIGFFEEFPTKQNLDKLKLIDFPVELYIAAEGLEEFMAIKKELPIKNVVYWPILKREEGYWMSPFSRRKALKRIISELKGSKEKIKVLWDCEFPLEKNLWMKEFHNFLRNKRLIRKFIKNAGSYNKEIITAEYPLENIFFEYLFRFFALSFNQGYKHKKMDMLYTSLAKNKVIEHYLERQMVKCKRLYGRDYYAGLGVIGKGVLGNEKQLTNSELKRDLNIAKKIGVENVIIYRLGGVDKEKAKIVKEFIS